MRKEQSFQQMTVGQLDMHTQTPYTEINLKCITDLGIRGKTIKLLGESIGVNCDLGLDNSFLDRKSQAQATKDR